MCRERDPCLSSQHSLWFALGIGILMLCCFGLCILGFRTERCLLYWVWDVLITSTCHRFCFDWLTSCRSVMLFGFGLSLSCFVSLYGCLPWRLRFRFVVCPSRSLVPVWLIALCCVRFGEACHPGPSWTLGLCNINGLSSKVGFFHDNPCDTWLLCETHLTASGKRSFAHALRGLQSPYVNFAHGHPVMPRTEASDVGQWTGVGVVSKCPLRSLPHSWPAHVYKCSRLACTASLHHNVWVSGCVMYGPPGGPTHPKARETVDHLLQLCIDRMLQSVGPRYIAGDFNHDLERLTTTVQLEKLGFREIQDVHAAKTGHWPQATCRGKTRRDFLFMSPELCDLFTHCEVQDHDWSDHSCLIAHFRGGPDALLRFPWFKPDPMTWMPQRQAFDMPQFADPALVDADYRFFWSQVEESNFCAQSRAGLPVVRACSGRGRTTKPHKRLQQLAPVKTGRAGDRIPEFFGSNLQHVQWVKQSRRLQSFVRLMAAPLSPTHLVHRDQLWTSILLAPGFQPSFSAWWAHRELRHGEPAQIPCVPPPADMARLIQLGLDFELNQLEKALRHSRTHARKLQRTSEVGALYRDVKRDPPVQVDSLLQSLSSSVVAVHPHDGSVSLEPPCLWISSQEFACPHGSFVPVHVESDRLWLEDGHSLAVGDVVRQEVCTGSLPALFQAFEDQWAALWHKHSAVPESQWTSIIAFAEQHLRPVEATMPEITNAQILATARSKKPRAAIGLDGVSRSDVLELRPAELDSVRAMFALAENTGTWAQAILHGGVRSLAKVPDPQQVSHFRPICVFGFLYRIWSSLHSRFWLSALADGSDAWLCGNKKHCQAATIWSHLMERVESARHSDIPLSGITLDLMKAFNTLPRKPTLHAVKLMGVAQPTLVGWAGALAKFHRHFIVRGSYSPGLKSTCGLPEGCGMSCVGMFAISQMFHQWMQASSPRYRALTFVDDWTVLLSDASFATAALETALQFTAALDLTIDKAKTFSWSSHAETRQTLRDQGHRVVGSCRELGAHLAFTRQITNKTLGDRFAELDGFWTKLRAAPCTFQQKIMLINRVAWPRALHAVSAVVVGKQRFAALRTSYMRAVRLDKPGVNPFLQCFLDGFASDPQVFAIVSTIRDFRVHGQSPDSLLNLSLSCHLDSPDVWTHASTVLRLRLEQCGLSLHSTGFVSDRFGTFDLANCSMPDLLVRLECGWTLKVASSVAHRASFAMFASVDAPSTRADLKLLSNYDQGVVRRHLNGASFTNEHAQYWNSDGQSLCVRCGCPDSLRHRLWCCVASQPLRDALPPFVLERVPELPDVCALHGWTLCSSHRDAWFEYLCSLPDDPVFTWPEDLPPILDLFTDGTAWCPAEPRARVAAWSVVLHSPCSEHVSAWHVHPVAAQPLSGLTQTVYRAELRAVVAAVSFAIQASRFCRIWSDCQAVISGFSKFVVRRFPVNPNHAHADLWRELQLLVWDFGVSRVQIIKVPSHQGLDSEQPAFDRWYIVGN